MTFGLPRLGTGLIMPDAPGCCRSGAWTYAGGHRRLSVSAVSRRAAGMPTLGQPSWSLSPMIVQMPAAAVESPSDHLGQDLLRLAPRRLPKHNLKVIGLESVLSRDKTTQARDRALQGSRFLWIEGEDMHGTSSALIRSLLPLQPASTRHGR